MTMTSITRLRFRKCWCLTLGSFRRQSEAALVQQLGDHRNDPLQQARSAEGISTTDADGPLNRTVALPSLESRRNRERGRDHGVKLEDVSDVIDEALRFASMKESDGRSVPCGKDRGLGQPVEASGPGGDGPIGEVCLVPLCRVVAAALPLDPVQSRECPVGLSDPHTLNTTKLIHRATRWWLLTEPHSIHCANYPKPCCLIKRRLRLKKKAICSRPTRLPCCVEPDAGLTDPDQKATNPCRKRDRSVRDADTWLQHQARQPTNRDLYPRTILVDEHECPIDDIDLTVLKENNRRAFLQGDRSQRNVGCFTHFARLRPGG